MAEKQQPKNTKSKNLIEDDLSKAKIVRKRSNPMSGLPIQTTPTGKKPSSTKRGTASQKTKPPEDQEIPSNFPKPKPGKGMPIVEGTKLTVKMSLEVSMKKTTLQQPKKPVRSADRVIDEHNQIFEYGSATVVVINERGLPEERVIPLEAEDVELITKLLGAVET